MLYLKIITKIYSILSSNIKNKTNLYDIINIYKYICTYIYIYICTYIYIYNILTL